MDRIRIVKRAVLRRTCLSALDPDGSSSEYLGETKLYMKSVFVCTPWLARVSILLFAALDGYAFRLV